ncbi:MAG: hypothetical protein GX279_07260 [Clostridiaceae bacterium]|jgi:hypothetical protein|nr:hypothetical protein [Clostridiaceae bacterium]
MDTNKVSGITIEKLKTECVKIWESTPDTFPVLHKSYTAYEHAVNDKRLKAFIDDSVRLVKGFRGDGEDPVQWGTAFKHLIYDCGVNVVGLSGDSMRVLLDGGFCDVTSGFISEARRFDPVFSLDDILQSLRNVWIMNCIQKLMDMEIELTPSIQSYSMLYPYTDNFIDANSISVRKKHDTNSKLGKRLSGEPAAAETPLEEKLFRLVGMIEGQYERSRYPMVYQSLRGIHDAQVRSMQQDNSVRLAREEILDISVEKGGSSVLADGCLIKGSLSEDESRFIFCFGILLQFLDDLQDIMTDKINRHRTMFSTNGGRDELQRLTNRLINFTANVMDTDGSFTGAGAKQIKKLMKDSIILLIMGAVAGNDRIYEKKYLAALQGNSPISFRCFKNSYKRIGREYGRLKLKFSVKSLEIPMSEAFASGNLS